jgi:hypothetical protein
MCSESRYLDPEGIGFPTQPGIVVLKLPEIGM